MPVKLYLLIFFVLGMLPTLSSASDQGIQEKSLAAGKLSYDFYCYQCHGYAGDARTLASTYLSPAPRDFTATSPEKLTQQAMIDAVTHGRDGTAMVSFSSVLNSEEINKVVRYIRESFMQNVRQPYIYHTAENGWPNHQRYNNAFPFASGKLPLDTPWQQLSEDQKTGKTLFMQSCVSCHDRSVVNDEGPIWELRPLSYPRKHYDHRAPLDSISGASPYQVHEQVEDISQLNQQQQRGAVLFQQNCAFCHAADATGKNWIGRFMEPHARDLTSAQIIQRPEQPLLAIIREGLENTSMPAWKHVLSDNQIIDIIHYLKRPQDNQHHDLSL